MSCHILAYSGTSGSLFLNIYKFRYFNGKQENKSIIHVRVRSLVMPNGDPWDSFFYPTLTLMIDSYTLVSVMVLITQATIVWLSISFPSHGLITSVVCTNVLYGLAFHLHNDWPSLVLYMRGSRKFLFVCSG